MMGFASSKSAKRDLTGHNVQSEVEIDTPQERRAVEERSDLPLADCCSALCRRSIFRVREPILRRLDATN